MIVTEIELFNILREKIGDNEAKVLSEYVESKVERTFEAKKDTLSTKNDINDVKLEIVELKILIQHLDTKISEAKYETLKWMITAMVGTAGLIVAAMKLL